MPEGGCDVWVARLEAFARRRRALDALLSPVERAQVESLRREEDRDRARASRGLLRVLAGRYLGLDPRLLEVDRRCPVCGEAHGRPRLTGPGAPSLELSVAHCSDLLVLAFDAGAAVGVDVERLDDLAEPPSPELMELVLTPHERARVLDAPAATRSRLFLGYWTCKEAVVKQLGTGVSVPLSSVGVEGPGPPRRAAVEVEGHRGAHVWVGSLEVGPSHAAALATAREMARPRIVEVPVGLVL
jgi:4'-phosphopantetheinyl transferase